MQSVRQVLKTRTSILVALGIRNKCEQTNINSILGVALCTPQYTFVYISHTSIQLSAPGSPMAARIHSVPPPSVSCLRFVLCKGLRHCLSWLSPVGGFNKPTLWRFPLKEDAATCHQRESNPFYCGQKSMCIRATINRPRLVTLHTQHYGVCSHPHTSKYCGPYLK